MQTTGQRSRFHQRLKSFRRAARTKNIFILASALLMPSGPASAQSALAPPWSEEALSKSITLEEAATSAATDPDALIAHGERLFIGKFTSADGAGRPNATQAIIPTKRRRPSPFAFQRLAGPDANSCASCHNEPVIGGAGAFTTNVFVSEGFESADFDTIDQQFSNERSTNALQGAGLVELLAREMSADLQAQRRDALRQARAQNAPVTHKLKTKNVTFGSITARPDGTLDISGIEGIDADLVLRPFSQKGVFASLRQFTVNALNAHHGIQAQERFGAAWTGSDDFDEDGHEDEIGAGDVSALVIWQATLPAPTRKEQLPPRWRSAAVKGEEVFTQIGCASCHLPFLPLENTLFEDPSPFEGAGTLRQGETQTPVRIDLAQLDWAKKLKRNEQGHLLVPLWGDLKRHKIADARHDAFGNELLGQRFVDRDVFITAELWGIGSTAPYGHRGDITRLHEVIEAHGGEAGAAREAYSALDEESRQSIIAFLRSLEIRP